MVWALCPDSGPHQRSEKGQRTSARRRASGHLHAGPLRTRTTVRHETGGPLGAARSSLRADELLAEMLETVISLIIGAGPADDAVAGGICSPVAVPAVFAVHSAAVHAVCSVGTAPATDAPAADGSACRRRLLIRCSPVYMPISIDGGASGSKTRAGGEFSLAGVRIGEGRLRQCSRTGQGGCRNHGRARESLISSWLAPCGWTWRRMPRLAEPIRRLRA